MTDKDMDRRVSALEDEIPVIRDCLHSIDNKLSKQNGFIAGVLFVLTPVFLGVLYVLKLIWTNVTGT